MKINISGQLDPDIHNGSSTLGSVAPREQWDGINTSSQNSQVQANKALFTSCIPHVAPPTLDH